MKAEAGEYDGECLALSRPGLGQGLALSLVVACPVTRGRVAQLFHLLPLCCTALTNPQTSSASRTDSTSGQRARSRVAPQPSQSQFPHTTRTRTARRTEQAARQPTTARRSWRTGLAYPSPRSWVWAWRRSWPWPRLCSAYSMARATFTTSQAPPHNKPQSTPSTFIALQTAALQLCRPSYDSWPA